MIQPLQINLMDAGTIVAAPIEAAIGALFYDVQHSSPTHGVDTPLFSTTLLALARSRASCAVNAPILAEY